MPDHEHTWGLALAFDTDDPEFIRGVEVGMLYEQLTTNPEQQTHIAHAANAEMVLRLAEACGRTARATWEDDYWMHVEFTAGATDA
ncbi:MAG: hypothetical protein KGL39_29925 [Patescibacteria group bacterium]|nr:hypothetical protein [Patescibacteria group bacterium]